MRDREWRTIVVWAIGVCVVPAGGWSEERPTFNRDVAPILYSHCVECHRPNSVAPMSLLTYEEARPWAKAMKKAVLQRDMPPWDADPAVGTFSNDISLPQSAIDAIAAWVDADAPAGDPADLPATPEFPEGWRLGTPDYVVELPEYSVPATGDDLFPNLVVSLEMPGEAHLRAVELVAGDPHVVHHLILFHGLFTMNEEVIDRRPPNRRGGVMQIDAPDVMYVWAAGSPPGVFPDGMGHVLRPGDTVSINAHYHPYGEATVDRSRVGLYFAPEPLQKQITTAVALNPALRIPPNSADHIQRAYYVFAQDSHIVSYLPHMHLRGSAIRYVMHYPDGTEEELLNVPRYDYGWQWIYYPKSPVAAPAGSTLEVIGQWDNSSTNPRNPDPHAQIRFGEGTDAEMLVGFAEYVVDEGVQPTTTDPESLVRTALRRHPADECYYAPSPLYKLGMHVPREGEGTLYIAVGSVLITATIYDIVWRDDRAIMNTRMVTLNADSEPLGVRLVVDGDAVNGALYFGRELGEGHLDAPPETPGQNFSGTRLRTQLAGSQ